MISGLRFLNEAEIFMPPLVSLISQLSWLWTLTQQPRDGETAIKAISGHRHISSPRPWTRAARQNSQGALPRGVRIPQTMDLTLPAERPLMYFARTSDVPWPADPGR
jgi:hypothetical protein